MKTKSHLPTAALVAIVAFSSSLMAQAEVSPDTPTKRQSGYDLKDSKLSHADRNFFEEASKSGTKEVEISSAVKSRLTNTQVSGFADMMITDHAAANTELQALAAKKGVTLPADRKDYTAKWSKNNKDLDDDYIGEMEDDHEKAVKLFEKAAKSEDPDIAAFARKTLPKLEQHLTEVRALNKAVK